MIGMVSNVTNCVSLFLWSDTQKLARQTAFDSITNMPAQRPVTAVWNYMKNPSFLYIAA